ncbi:MAG: [FeFe] hydrogenase H-cluster maturation GTPase HydF [Clostridium sp.]|nr:[FeFe] hydrogenase H-cluster maturation GTPase HydF [Clostridium sp.]MCM1398614.1 [FeFe] hydrogenase H-cluster maturation GTPase HydF [Clostridium sp.]MCM1459900.1 [FeFe] hydrogenase H-cluster maturation GTPase HydF [Bacteroides sp.]
MNGTPSANRLHIGFFGRRNAGKSSVVNAVTNQDMSVVSDVLGTTTDPVTKAMELLPIGPVLIIDTPGFDDRGEIGELRVKKTKQVLNKTDVAILVVDSTEGMSDNDNELIEIFKDKGIKYLVVYNKCDLLSVKDMRRLAEEENAVLVSAKDKKNINQLKEKITLIAGNREEKPLVSDLVEGGDIVILVVPIDSAAPKGRLILPQQQVIRDLLDAGALPMVVKESGLVDAMDRLKEKPRMIITDSQVFNVVKHIVPTDISLTSFSILMARYKGFLDTAVAGVKTLDTLEGEDRVLICEGCTHHRQCEDIGTVKLPAWLQEYTGKHLQFSYTSGGEFPDDLTKYKLIVHCGGCMLNEKEVLYRMKCAEDAGVPFTNYGTVIAFMQGILDRAVKPVMI